MDGRPGGGAISQAVNGPRCDAIGRSEAEAEVRGEKVSASRRSTVSEDYGAKAEADLREQGEAG